MAKKVLGKSNSWRAAALMTEEIDHMLEWLPYLSAVFPEAVQLVVRMPLVPLQRSFIIHEIKDSKLPERYPNELAQLLIYLGASKTPGFMWHGLHELIDKLDLTKLDSSLKQGIDELVAKLGLPRE